MFIKKNPYFRYGLSYISVFFLFVFTVSTNAAFSKKPISIVVLGDSISNNYGTQINEGWVSLLQPKIQQDYPNQNILITNASISGDTTAGGLRRLPPLIHRYHPQLLILELGGNDGLRGISLNQMQQNLEKIIQYSRKFHVNVLLLGMRIPPNYGATYTQGFHETYKILAKKYHLLWIPCIYANIYNHANLMQADGIHPNAQGQKLILQNVYPSITYALQLSSHKPIAKDCVL